MEAGGGVAGVKAAEAAGAGAEGLGSVSERAHNRESIMMAIAAIKENRESGTKLSVRNAAVRYGVSKSTLHRYLSKDEKGFSESEHEGFAPETKLEAATAGGPPASTVTAARKEPETPTTFPSEHQHLKKEIGVEEVKAKETSVPAPAHAGTAPPDTATTTAKEMDPTPTATEAAANATTVPKAASCEKESASATEKAGTAASGGPQGAVAAATETEATPGIPAVVATAPKHGPAAGAGASASEKVDGGCKLSESRKESTAKKGRGGAGGGGAGEPKDAPKADDGAGIATLIAASAVAVAAKKRSASGAATAAAANAAAAAAAPSVGASTTQATKRPRSAVEPSLKTDGKSTEEGGTKEEDKDTTKTATGGLETEPKEQELPAKAAKVPRKDASSHSTRGRRPVRLRSLENDLGSLQVAVRALQDRVQKLEKDNCKFKQVGLANG